MNKWTKWTSDHVLNMAQSEAPNKNKKEKKERKKRNNKTVMKNHAISVC